MVWPVWVVVAILIKGSCSTNNTLPPGEEPTVDGAEPTADGEEGFQDVGYDTANETLPEDPDTEPLPAMSFSNNSFSGDSSSSNSFSNNSSSGDSSYSNSFSNNSSSGDSSSSNSSTGKKVSSGDSKYAHVLAAKCMGSLLLLYFAACIFLAARSGPLVVT